MEMGELVPTAAVLDILAEAMVQSKYAGNEKGFLLDAYPMNLEQAAAFESFIAPPTKVVYLSLEQEVMVGRLLDRGNFDDVDEAIKKRCENFQNQTRPVLEKYSANLSRINADRAAEEVTADILANIK